MKEIWYAVQNKDAHEEGTWDYGSHDYDEAVAMAKEIKEKEGYAVIATIDVADEFCMDEEEI